MYLVLQFYFYILFSNIFNIQNVGSLTNKSTITNHSNNNLNEDLEPRAIEECDD